MKPDRAPGPSRGGFCDCGWEGPVIPRAMTELDIAEHDVHHLEWRATNGTGAAGLMLLTAYRTLLPKLRASHEQRRNQLGAKVVDLEIQVASYEWDIKVLNELVDDLKADLAACEEGRDV